MKRIEAILGGLAGLAATTRVGIAYHHLETGETFTIGNQSFPAASLIKVPIMAACYREAVRKRLCLNERVALSAPAGDGNEPFDHLVHAPQGEFTLRKLVDRMITESDNTATNTLIDLLGFEAIRALLEDWGLIDTKLQRKMFDWEAQSEGRENQTTPADMVRCFLQLQQDPELAPYRSEIWCLLTHQRDRTKFARRLPASLDLAHKTGELPNVRHDAGRIDPEHPYLLAILTENAGELGNTLIGRLTEAIHAHAAESIEQKEALASKAEEAINRHLPDSRLGFAEYQIVWKNKMVLEGKTSVAAIREELGLEGTIDQPGIVTASAVHLRREPSHTSEMVSQALLGTPLRFLDEKGDWWRIQTPDGYVGWVRQGNVSNDPSLLADFEGSHVILTAPIQALGGRLFSAGSRLLRLSGSLGTPSGETVPCEGAFRSSAEKPSLETLITWALAFRGVPYLWGGKSGWGIDCSGLTQLLAALGGIDLPRDADQQEAFLPPIARPDLRRGDLVFFPGHVGLYLGNDRVLHASAKRGEVCVESLAPHDPSYNPWLDSSLRQGGRFFSN